MAKAGPPPRLPGESPADYSARTGVPLQFAVAVGEQLDLSDGPPVAVGGQQQTPLAFYPPGNFTVPNRPPAPHIDQVAARSQLQMIDELAAETGSIPAAVHRRVVDTMNEALRQTLVKLGCQPRGKTHSQLLHDLTDWATERRCCQRKSDTDPPGANLPESP